MNYSEDRGIINNLTLKYSDVVGVVKLTIGGRALAGMQEVVGYDSLNQINLRIGRIGVEIGNQVDAIK